MAKKNLKIYTVSQINTLIKSVLADSLPGRFSITAEISDCKAYASGHCYFTLKDGNSVMPCVMWKGSFAKLKFKPENGMAVMATGHIDVYEPGGKYQFYATRMEPAGVGDLHLKFEQLKTRLAAEGLFSDEHKKPIPKYPMRIGIVTSQTGAALADIADSIYNRWPCAKLLLYPSLVQGDKAAAEIAAAIKNINRRNKQLRLDVLIVGRGGGSLEDLWAFNEELVARAIYNSKIPIISAVGHEIDVTIADFVADARASTPTKAGVIAAADMNEVIDRIENIRQRLAATAERNLEYCSRSLLTVLASAVFKTPYSIISTAAQQLDEASRKLIDSAEGMFSQLNLKLDSARERIQKIEPHRLIGDKRLGLTRLAGRTNSAIVQIIGKNKLKLTALENRLASLDPRSVLTRGYSITTNSRTGGVVTQPEDVEIGDQMLTELASRKTIASKVTKKSN
jgi:exodeoxyribonuclease VII large subunit